MIIQIFLKDFVSVFKERWKFLEKCRASGVLRPNGESSFHGQEEFSFCTKKLGSDQGVIHDVRDNDRMKRVGIYLSVPRG